MSGIWELLALRQAAERILIEASFLRRQDPTLTPLERLQAARARCVTEVLEALVAIVKAQELAQNGAWTSRPVSPPRGMPWMGAYHRKRKREATERRAQIRATAAAHPDWSSQQIAEYVGVHPDTVRRALQAPSNLGQPIHTRNRLVTVVMSSTAVPPVCSSAPAAAAKVSR